MPKTRSIKDWWKIPAIIICLITISVILALIRSYLSFFPMECFQCSWISHPHGSALTDDPCGKDQRLILNSTVKTCDIDQPFCGVLHISFSYYQLSTGSRQLKQLEYAFVRDCFAEYPLSYVLKVGGENKTYHGSRNGNVYPNVAGNIGLNLTLIGQECTSWNHCNSNIPKEGWAASFLDSVTILEKAKLKGISVWRSLLDFIKQDNSTKHA